MYGSAPLAAVNKFDLGVFPRDLRTDTAGKDSGDVGGSCLIVGAHACAVEFFGTNIALSGTSPRMILDASLRIAVEVVIGAILILTWRH